MAAIETDLQANQQRIPLMKNMHWDDCHPQFLLRSFFAQRKERGDKGKKYFILLFPQNYIVLNFPGVTYWGIQKSTPLRVELIDLSIQPPSPPPQCTTQRGHGINLFI